MRDTIAKQARHIDTLRRTVDVMEDRVTELLEEIAKWNQWEQDMNELLRE